MGEPVWKVRERQVSALFKSTRTPLSGGNSGHTRSDTLSSEFFVEHKHRKTHAVYQLWKDTRDMARVEGKTPVVTLSQSGEKGFLVVVHSDHFVEIACKLGELYAVP